MPKIFVYGTLKTGQINHRLLCDPRGSSRIVPLPATAPGIVLHAGPHYPLAIRGQGQAIGEVYTITESVLKKLDVLENHPDDYHREITPVIVINGHRLLVWIYLHNQAYHYPKITTGLWQPNKNQRYFSRYSFVEQD
jgi:gamma-glutamylaminecyclotransferase